VRDIDWEEMVAPEAERFLSTVQRYVHSRGVYDPEEGSSAWVFIELFRPGVNTAIERAIAYNKRMREYYQRLISGSPHEAPRLQPTSDLKAKPDPLGTESETKTQKKDTTAQVTDKGESGSVSTEKKRFKIALSYPGERRAFVEQVASYLAERIGRDRVLYDKYYEAEFSRFDLDNYLQRLYHDESELIAVFLCADYEIKEWCGLEWRAIRDLIKRRRASAVMPFRFDQTEIAGLFSIDGYVSIETRSAKEVAELILERLALNAGNQARD
jgi:TIR domain